MLRNAFLLALLLPVVALAGELQGRVVAVSDGDTITVLDASNTQVVVRLANIDAPETSCHQHNEALAEVCTETSQPFGKASKKSLSSLLFGKSVRVLTVDGSRGTSYGRIVGTVFAGNLDANLEQVKAGLAWHYVAYAKHQQTPEVFALYTDAERAARASHSGLWSDKSPVPPWELRHPR